MTPRRHRSVAHIIDAVRSTRFEPPADIDHARLRRDIDRAKTRGTVLCAGADRQAWRDRRKRAEQIAKAADVLRMLLASGPEGEWCARELGSHMPASEGAARPSASTGRARTHEVAPSMRAMQAGLVRIGRAARRELLKPRLSGDALWRHDFNIGTWLIAVGLPPIFLQHFQEEPKIGRVRVNYDEDPTAANSPYIRFAETVLADLSISGQRGPYTRETIAREFVRERGGHAPRRRGAVSG